ncbi:MAG: signal recognition particle protein [Rickettsiales bacterium]
MFSKLGNSLGKIFDKLRGKGNITEDDLNLAMREIRVALLEADVALTVAKDFIKIIHEKAIGAELIKSVTPGQQIVKIVHDELITLLGSESQELNLSIEPPAVIMMVGLQGSGKTTSSAKLALRLLNKTKKKALLASLDIYRPAAQEQLQVLGTQLNIACLPIVPTEKPLEITQRALKEAKLGGFDVLILDTAGRLHTDNELIAELQQVKKLANPIETLLVADSLTGQDAVNIAKEFNEKVGITGIILTRIDGDARGGAALSMRQITNAPIKFIGVGEKPTDFEEFYPERIASRILDMGDVVSLVEKAAEAISEEEALSMTKRMQKGQFDLNDLLAQLRNLKKMGGMGKILNFIPGIGKYKAEIEKANINEKTFAHQEAIILSMTKKERRNPDLLNASRRKRIASGSGTSVQEVNKLIKQFMTMHKMMRKMGGLSPEKIEQMGRMMNVR